MKLRMEKLDILKNLKAKNRTRNLEIFEKVENWDLAKLAVHKQKKLWKQVFRKDCSKKKWKIQED